MSFVVRLQVTTDQIRKTSAADIGLSALCVSFFMICFHRYESYEASDLPCIRRLKPGLKYEALVCKDKHFLHSCVPSAVLSYESQSEFSSEIHLHALALCVCSHGRNQTKTHL